MTSVRFAYVFAVIFATTLHSSGVVVSAMENFDTTLIENSVPTDAGLDSGVQRRLRGTMTDDQANEERGPSLNAGMNKLADGINNSWTTRIAETLKKMREKQWFRTKQFQELIKSIKKIKRVVVKNSGQK